MYIKVLVSAGYLVLDRKDKHASSSYQSSHILPSPHLHENRIAGIKNLTCRIDGSINQRQPISLHLQYLHPGHSKTFGYLISIPIDFLLNLNANLLPGRPLHLRRPQRATLRIQRIQKRLGIRKTLFLRRAGDHPTHAGNRRCFPHGGDSPRTRNHRQCA